MTKYRKCDICENFNLDVSWEYSTLQWLEDDKEVILYKDVCSTCQDKVITTLKKLSNERKTSKTEEGTTRGN